MATIVTRAGKGSALTHTEMDANFTNLNNDKLETGPVTTSGLTMATGKLLGRSTASSGAVEEITVGSGLTLSSGTLTASAGAGTNLGYTASTRLLTSSTGTDVTLPLFSTTSTDAGLVPGNSSLGATYFLTAAGTWAVPAGGGGSGTVTSVGISSSGSSLTVSGSPITTSGTINVELNPANANSFTGEQTFKEIKETVFTLATSGTIALDPANGSIQSSVLTGNPTFTDSLQAGQTLVVHIENGSTYTVTFPTMTWVTSSGNSAPTLTAKDTIVFWKISTTLYGAYVGSYA